MAAEHKEDELPAALGWVVSLLEPGTRPGVFTFFKMVVFTLVLTLAGMLHFLEVDAEVAMHLKIFLGLATVLACITVWFFYELQIAQAAAPASAEVKKDK
eukprot:CAMPEP_0185164642 /NCGR_PEP_ID=MMETSP1139-20130426/9688_1 /TAXON_ID=298111 /ORGANISM="Pavlova sp., Strain CCMP459" /LENGTH=99 /DNA_ID=CAMNT_0027730021 /DNA_START=14 /DNA_END=313 /DNA_ORIENTATION=-